MSGLDVKQLAAGDNHSCVLTALGDIYTWGRGDYGQLGHGNMNSRDVPTLLQVPVLLMCC
jgi:alpha-tubulin suppressor-like RCC1 family protein